MKTIAHMGRRVGLFPAPSMVRIVCTTGAGERFLQMFYRAIKKRRRIEYFKAQQRKQKRKE